MSSHNPAATYRYSSHCPPSVSCVSGTWATRGHRTGREGQGRCTVSYWKWQKYSENFHLKRGKTPNSMSEIFHCSPSSPLALLVGYRDVVALVEDVQQGPRRQTEKWRNDVQHLQSQRSYATVQTAPYLHLWQSSLAHWTRSGVRVAPRQHLSAEGLISNCRTCLSWPRGRHWTRLSGKHATPTRDTAEIIPPNVCRHHIYTHFFNETR